MRSKDERFVSEDSLHDAAIAWLRVLLAPEDPEGLVMKPDPLVSSAPPPITQYEGSEALSPTETKEEATSNLARRARFGHRMVSTFRIAPSWRCRDQREIRRARRDLDEAIKAAPESRFVQFARSLGLSAFEQDILLLLYFHGTNLGIEDLCAARSESDNGYPTFALSLRLGQDDEWDSWPPERQEKSIRLAAQPDWIALSPEGPLRHWKIIEITQPGGKPLISSPLRLDERIVNHLKGIDYMDDRIASLCRLRPFEDDPISGSQQNAIDEATTRLRALADHTNRLTVQMPGSDVQTRCLFALHLADRLRAQLYRVSLDQLLNGATAADFARLWNRECRLRHVALDIDATDASAESVSFLTRLVVSLDGIVFVDVPDPVPGLETSLILDVARPTPAEQRELWLGALGEEAGDWAERLAGQFNLNVRDIAEAVDLTGDGLDGAILWERLHSRGRTRLEGLAQRIVPNTNFDDVQLPEDTKRMLRRITDQARHRVTVYDRYGFRARLSRGLGITALFEGESGTGKTMAAEALANELRLDLYRIDLANVVSKYIGETEKNLKRVFDAAEESGAVLLFDEADAIFGKRSEVQDSHDRYANIEVSYLLQRMEAYEGLAILTTNMKSALDQAFLRRLRFVITFPFPGPKQRRRIWEGILPKDGHDDATGGLEGINALDLDALARPPLTGGQIRNIAVNGAFLAAAGNGVITMGRLREAAEDELRKNGRPFVASDFSDWRTPETSRDQPVTQEAL